MDLGEDRTAGSSRRGKLPSANSSILDAISWRQLCIIVWRAMPLPWRLIAFPYGLIVYRRLFAASDTLKYLRAMHARQYSSSFLFRLMRPRFHRVVRLLRAYGVEDQDEDQADQQHAPQLGHPPPPADEHDPGASP
jgi:hypothetical protein